MPPSRQAPGPGLSSAVGVAAGLLALFLLSGRWSLSRMTSADLGLLGEPRIYIVLSLLFIALAPSLRDRGDAVPRSADRTLLRALLFYGYMALTTVWAPRGIDPTKLLELFLVFVCVAATLRLMRAMPPAQVTTLLWRWLVPALSGFALLGVMGSGGERLAVLGGGPNVFGRNMALLCVCLLSLVLQRRGSRLLLGAVIVAGALVLLSGSRGAMLAGTAGLAVVLYFNTGQLRRIVRVGLVVALVAACVLEFTDFGAKTVDMFRHRVLQLALEDGYDSGRSEVYVSAWELGLGSPWFGIGLAGFPVVGNHVYPHNLFLEVFCEGGLVGLGLLLLLLGPPLAAIVRRTPGAAPRDHAALVVVLISAQFSGDLYDSRLVVLFAVVLTMLTDETHPASRRRAPCGPAPRPLAGR